MLENPGARTGQVHLHLHANTAPYWPAYSTEPSRSGKGALYHRLQASTAVPRDASPNCIPQGDPAAAVLSLELQMHPCAASAYASLPQCACTTARLLPAWTRDCQPGLKPDAQSNVAP